MTYKEYYGLYFILTCEIREGFWSVIQFQFSYGKMKQQCYGLVECERNMRDIEMVSEWMCLHAVCTFSSMAMLFLLRWNKGGVEVLTSTLKRYVKRS
jgi:hypothetical protein